MCIKATVVFFLLSIQVRNTYVHVTAILLNITVNVIIYNPWMYLSTILGFPRRQFVYVCPFSHDVNIYLSSICNEY